MSASRLKIENLLDSILREDVVAASYALAEPEAAQERSQFVERDRRIGSSLEDPREQVV
jgi:hypothetical protein